MVVAARIKKQFMQNVTVNATTGCWEWTKSKAVTTYSGRTELSYGWWRISGRTVQAHVAAWILFRGERPSESGLMLDHLCHAKNCVNPKHLEPVTPQQNTWRARIWSNLEWGCNHSITGDNVYYARAGEGGKFFLQESWLEGGSSNAPIVALRHVANCLGLSTQEVIERMESTPHCLTCLKEREARGQSMGYAMRNISAMIRLGMISILPRTDAAALQSRVTKTLIYPGPVQTVKPA